MIKCVILFLACLAVVSCGFKWGGCPTYTRNMESFDITRYTGKWYEIAREKSTPFQKGDCTTAQYSQNEEGSVTVLNTELLPNGQYQSAQGKAISTSDPFRFKVSFSDSFFGKLFKGDYQVVETDYDNFSIVYSCTDLLVGRIEYYWLLSRNPHIESDFTVSMLKVVSDRLDVSADSFRFTNQEKEKCGY